MFKYSEIEILAVRNLKAKGYKWLARDKGGTLHAYEDEPYKSKILWLDNGYSGLIVCSSEVPLLQDIKWEDKDPTSLNSIAHPSILDSTERRYLECVLRPLKKVEYIARRNISENDFIRVYFAGNWFMEFPNNSDTISRQAAIDALDEQIALCNKALGSFDISMKDEYAVKVERASLKAYRETLNVLPSAQGKPFNLPEIYIADGYDTIEGEDGNVGFGVYDPDENQIYVAGDVEGEIRVRALLHEICHWVQAMCGRPFDEDEANEFSDIVYDALPSAQETHEERTETHACDCISRQAAIDELDKGAWGVEWDKTLAKTMIESLPSAQPEPLTDKEQKIFLAAMRREEKVCKQVDGLVKTCHEIIRKVNALWTI